jgi:hypothetical protein
VEVLLFFGVGRLWSFQIHTYTGRQISIGTWPVWDYVDFTKAFTPSPVFAKVSAGTPISTTTFAGTHRKKQIPSSSS